MSDPAYSSLLFDGVAVWLREQAPRELGATRMIGRPREFKGRMEVLCCREEGVGEFTLQKRDAPGLYKTLRKDRADTLQKWEYQEGKILPAEE